MAPVEFASNGVTVTLRALPSTAPSGARISRMSPCPDDGAVGECRNPTTRAPAVPLNRYSSTSPSGSIISTPIIPQPQAAILSAHAITRRPVVVAEDAIAIRSMMYLALSFDHRIVDGMTACRFVERIRERLEGMALDALD